jgi:hypothetical protein
MATMMDSSEMVAEKVASLTASLILVAPRSGGTRFNGWLRAGPARDHRLR